MPDKKLEQTKAQEEAQAAKHELRALLDDFHVEREQELEKSLADKKTQARIGRVISENIAPESPETDEKSGD